MKRILSRPIMRTAVLSGAIMLLLSGCGPKYMVLDPAGPVGREELHLIVLTTVLTFAIIIPVLLLLAFIVWRYRDTPNNRAKYTPEWAESRWLEVVWWGIPIIAIAIIGVVTAKVTYNLVQPPEKNVKPLTIQVTSLDWKWLFQYPGQKVATVNYAVIPTGVPVQFELTADAPMDSFWVPRLGGQEYTMPGMAMRLWLQADKAGSYYGHGANFTGSGFAHNDFQVIAKSDTAFNSWVAHVKSTSPALTMAGYAKLKKPGLMSTASYSSFPKGLFKNTVWANGGRYMPDMLGGMNGTKSEGTPSNMSQLSMK